MSAWAELLADQILAGVRPELIRVVAAWREKDGPRTPIELVAPSVWQRAFVLAGGPRDEGITAKKNRHKARAQELFPNLKITHACADALLLAEYCRRTREGLDRITSNP